MDENKTAKTPADGGAGFIDGVWPGPTAWQCQCGKAYTVTCISSKPSKQEPVAWISHIPTIKVNGKQLHWTKEQAYKWSSDITPLYAAPKQWVGLTDKEVSDVIDNVLEGGGWLDVARALEAAIKRKNT
jgi:hypothetical protein